MKDLLYTTSGEADFDGADGKTMLHAGSDESGCWADVWDDDHQEYRPCEDKPGERSTLGLCSGHEIRLLARAPSGAAPRSGRAGVRPIPG
ncbi:MAG: hypothetical protein ACLPVF_11835 [Acidimicrobiales bacterium]